MVAVAIVSVGTTTTAAAGAAVDKAAMIAVGQLKQASVTLTTTDRLKVANDQVSNDITCRRLVQIALGYGARPGTIHDN